MSPTTTQFQRAINGCSSPPCSHHPRTRLVMPLPSTAAVDTSSHTHAVGPDQCCSAVLQTISAPPQTVWSIVRRFDNPQAYKQFLKSCHIIKGGGEVGSLREVRVVSGLPAASSRERLDILDEERHVMGFSVVGGDHRLSNYRSVTTVHPAEEGSTTATLVVESYVVDIPTGNSWDDTRAFVDTIVKCNLQSLAHIAEDLAKDVTRTNTTTTTTNR